MQISLRKIGTSKGIIIPATILKECGFKDSAEIKVVDNKIEILPQRELRIGWEIAAKKIGEEEKLDLLPDFLSEEADKDWI